MECGLMMAFTTASMPETELKIPIVFKNISCHNLSCSLDSAVTFISFVDQPPHEPVDYALASSYEEWHHFRLVLCISF